MDYSTAYALNGLGCGCESKPVVDGLGLSRGRLMRNLNGLGDVSDYAIVRIGGRNYTVNQLIGKQVIAYKDTIGYSNATGKGTPKVTIKAGKSIGTVASYIAANSKNSDGRSWLMFESSYNDVFFVPNEAVSEKGLEEQGTKTLEQERAAEEEKKKLAAQEALKDTSPLEYYVSKYAWKVGLGIAAVIIAKTVVAEYMRKPSTPSTASKEEK